MTEREKEVIEIIKKYPEEILEVVLDLLKKRYKIATKRDIKILYYKINLKITQLESRTNERIIQLENNTKLEIEKLRAEMNERINQLENNTKLEIEKLRIESNERISQLENNTKLEIEKIRAETKYHIAKSESRIIKFILASSIIQTIFIISAVLTIIFKAKP
jgi:anaerobic ribonucleoside-triphosphate reductase